MQWTWWYRTPAHHSFLPALLQVSPDGGFVAYAADLKGDEMYVIDVLDISTGSSVLSNGPIAGAAGALVWAADSKTLVYTALVSNAKCLEGIVDSCCWLSSAAKLPEHWLIAGRLHRAQFQGLKPFFTFIPQ